MAVILDCNMAHFFQSFVNVFFTIAKHLGKKRVRLTIELAQGTSIDLTLNLVPIRNNRAVSGVQRNHRSKQAFIYSEVGR
jgi:hypothetical protein